MKIRKSALFAALLLGSLRATLLSAAQTAPKQTWKPVELAIVRYNDEAPISWNLYHGEKRGVLLLHFVHRYLLIRVQDAEVYELDPQKVTPAGDSVQFSMSDVPDDPIEISEWKERNVGSLDRIRFRFGKAGRFLDIQIPLQPNGKPMY